jgi:hypothetical protein
MLLGPRVTADPNTISPASQAPVSSASSNGRPHAPEPPAPATQRLRGWRLWSRRIGALLFVTVCATFGVLLLILPWTPKWTDNPLLLTSPQLRDVVESGFIRGLASGLGLLDLWLGFWEAVHYHENSRQ